MPLVRRLWSLHEGPIDHEGRFYRAEDRRARRRRRATARGEIPIFTAGVNPRMIETAGRVADGLLGHTLFSPRYVEDVVRPAVERGAARPGRDPARDRDRHLRTGLRAPRRGGGAPRGRRDDRVLRLGQVPTRGCSSTPGSAARRRRSARRSPARPRGDGRRGHRARWSTSSPWPGRRRRSTAGCAARTASSTRSCSRRRRSGSRTSASPRTRAADRGCAP